MESSGRIEEQAAAWLLKRESESWTDADQLQLDEWLERATIHRVTFLRLEAGWEQANRLKALGAGLPRGTVPSANELATNPDELVSERHHADMPRTRRGLIGAAAAISALAIGVFVYTGPLAGERYATPVGGVASVPLKDGSNITLNTASKIRVRMSQEQRRIDLAEGEAFFDVAPDPTRPFVVQVGHKRVIAVGTKFSVRRDGEDVQVVVTEGIVRVEDSREEKSQLTAGAVARVSDGQIKVEEKPVASAEQALSWRSGYIVFQETPLTDAAAEFNRYNERKILIEDTAVGAIRLSGKFRSTNCETFVRLLEETYGIHAVHLSDRIVLGTEQGGASR